MLHYLDIHLEDVNTKTVSIHVGVNNMMPVFQTWQVFFKHFASENQLPGFYISGTMVENGLMIIANQILWSILATSKKWYKNVVITELKKYLYQVWCLLRKFPYPCKSDSQKLVELSGFLDLEYIDNRNIRGFCL